MPSKKQKVSLIVQCDNLPSLKFGHGRERGLEHAANGMPKTGYKIIQNQFWMVGCRTSMSLMAKISQAYKKRNRTLQIFALLIQ